jgi:hypothetical protein
VYVAPAFNIPELVILPTQCTYVPYGSHSKQRLFPQSLRVVRGDGKGTHSNAWLWVLRDSDHWQIADPSSPHRGRPKTKSKAIFRQKKGKRHIWSWAPKGCTTPRWMGRLTVSHNINSTQLWPFLNRLYEDWLRAASREENRGRISVTMIRNVKNYLVRIPSSAVQFHIERGQDQRLSKYSRLSIIRGNGGENWRG